jgi:hypothetical protein
MRVKSEKRPIREIRSFLVVLYNGNEEECGIFPVPVTVAAPFANRLFREALPGRRERLREPWYVLEPHYGGRSSERAIYPVGMTSLYGERYVPDEEDPPRVTLRPDVPIRYFTVKLLDLRTELYRGVYTVDDIFRAGAEYLARGQIERERLEADEGPFTYEVLPSTKPVRTAPPELFPPEAYQVEGVFQLPLLAEDRERTIFHRVKPEPLPERDPASFDVSQTHGKGEVERGMVLIHADVYRALKEDLPLSPRTEDGGYLLGTPYRQPDGPVDEEDEVFRWILEITDPVLAEGAWARPGMLLFTGESWSRITRRLDREEGDKKLVGWFHTHLFEATDSFGLSGMDQDLHRRYLTKPWQVAVLLNVDADGNRTVRCYQRGPEGDLVECEFGVISET